MTNSGSTVRLLLALLAIVLILPLIMMIFAWPMMGYWGGGHVESWHGMGGLGWAMLFVWLIPLILIILIGYLITQRWLDVGEKTADPAIVELRTAYARGEISEEEFEKRYQRLQSDDDFM